MARFDVYRHVNRKTNKAVPYLLDVQTDFLSMLATRMVVPLILADEAKAVRRLNPEFAIESLKVMV
jgi:toxin CcdB